MRKTDVTEYVITSDKFNEEFEGYKFALLTDLHANGYGIDLHYINKIIKEQKPDAILIAGDMFNKCDDRNITDTSNFCVHLQTIILFFIHWEIMNIKCYLTLNDMECIFRHYTDIL